MKYLCTKQLLRKRHCIDTSKFLCSPLGVGVYTLTLKSLSASFKLVLRLVLGLRCPIINAQLTPKEPAGKSLLYVPGITTLPAGTRPLYSMGEDLVTSIILVDCVSTTLAPSTASFSTITPSTTIDLLPIKQPSSTITGLACKGSSTPPIPTPP